MSFAVGILLVIVAGVLEGIFSLARHAHAPVAMGKRLGAWGRSSALVSGALAGRLFDRSASRRSL